MVILATGCTSTTTQTNTNTSAQTDSTQTEDMADWETFTDTTHSITFKHPADWKAIVVNTEGPAQRPGDILVEGDSCSMLFNYPYEGTELDQVEAIQNALVTKTYNGEPITPVSINGMEGFSYYVAVNDVQEKSDLYNLIINNNTSTISFALRNGTQDQNCKDISKTIIYSITN